MIMAASQVWQDFIAEWFASQQVSERVHSEEP